MMCAGNQSSVSSVYSSSASLSSGCLDNRRASQSMSVCRIHHTNTSRCQGLGTGKWHVTGQYGGTCLSGIMCASNSFCVGSGHHICSCVSLSGACSIGFGCSLRACKSHDRGICLSLSVSQGRCVRCSRGERGQTRTRC